MAVSLDDLEPEFRDLVKAALSDCKAAGVDMVPYLAIMYLSEQRPSRYSALA